MKGWINPKPEVKRGDAMTCSEETFDHVEQLYGFLQGEPVEGIHCDNMPHLTPGEAFSVIYLLQEHLHLLPDTIESCVKCEQLLNTDSEGHYVEDVGTYCDSCGSGLG